MTNITSATQAIYDGISGQEAFEDFSTRELIELFTFPDTNGISASTVNYIEDELERRSE